MKHLLMVLTLLLIAAVPSLAQSQADLITLNDATPSIDVAISLPPDATGTISLNLSNAAVTIKDENNTVVFYAADERIHNLDFNIAPNTGPHTLTVERLTGYSEAYVNVMSLPELTMYGSADLVSSNQVSLNQEADLTLNMDHPGETVAINIPEGTTGVVTASFPGANAGTQLVDSRGLLIAQSGGGHVDGLNFMLDAGQYHFTIRSSNLTDQIVAGVRAVSTEEAGLQVLEAPAEVAETVSTSNNNNCTGIVLYSSVNLRSGPGTGYSVLDYGYHGDAYPIGGQNPQNSWVVIGMADGSSAWLSRDTISIQGNCNELAVFDIPLREAQPAQIIISAPNNGNTAPVVSAASANTTSGYHDDDDDHYEYEHDEHEHDDDD